MPTAASDPGTGRTVLPDARRLGRAADLRRRAVRRTLDALYQASAWLAMASIVATFAMVILGVIGRMIDVNFSGSDAFAGYFMAAATFLGLAHTLKAGAHVRVTILLEHVSARAGRWLEVACHAIGVFLSGAFAWYSARLAWQSFVLNDISANADALPLWIPQTSMAAGAVLFFVALLDESVLLLRRGAAGPGGPGDAPDEAGGDRAGSVGGVGGATS